MQIVNFTAEHLSQAAALLRQNHAEARRALPLLPEPEPERFPDLSIFARKNMGVAAFADGELLGYLCSYHAAKNPIGIQGIKGAWSPLLAHAAVPEGRQDIYRHLYEAAARHWVEADAVWHAVTLYAHDKAAQEAFFRYGFGLRHMEAVRAVTAESLQIQDCQFAELPREDFAQVVPFVKLLDAHLRESPCFLPRARRTKRDILGRMQEDNSRMFVVRKEQRLIGCMEIRAGGESFHCAHEDTQNICNAYLLPEYRGRGIYEALLRFVQNTLHSEGTARLCVDFESANPTASGFWLKHFTPYTASVARRIDVK